MEIPVIGGRADGRRMPSGNAPRNLTLPCLLSPIPPWDPRARPGDIVQTQQEHYCLESIAVGHGDYHRLFWYYRLKDWSVEQSIDRLLEGYLRPKEIE